MCTEFASGIAQQIRDELEIASPSRVTAKIGAFAGEGFAVGLQSMSGEINRTISNVFALNDARIPDLSFENSGAWRPKHTTPVQSNKTMTYTYSPHNVFHINSELDVSKISRELDRQSLNAIRNKGASVL